MQITAKNRVPEIFDNVKTGEKINEHHGHQEPSGNSIEFN